MSEQTLKCPICKSGILRVIPNRETPQYYICRCCPERFRAGFRLDPDSEMRLWLLGVRLNPAFNKELTKVAKGLDFYAGLAAQAAKRAELTKQGVLSELETYDLGYEDSPSDQGLSPCGSG